MLFPEPVDLQLQVQQAFAAKAVCIFLIHEPALLFADLNAKALALRDIARLAGKLISATRAFMVFVVTHIRLVEKKAGIYAAIRMARRIYRDGIILPAIQFRSPGCRRWAA